MALEVEKLLDNELCLPSVHARIGRGSIKVATGDGSRALVYVHIRVVVPHDREDYIRRAHRSVSSARFRRIELIRALVSSPPVVSTLGDQVHFLIHILLNS